MELANIFDQAGFEALPNGIQLDAGIMLGSYGRRFYTNSSCTTLVDNQSYAVLEKSTKSFREWLDSRSELKPSLGTLKTKLAISQICKLIRNSKYLSERREILKQFNLKQSKNFPDPKWNIEWTTGKVASKRHQYL